MPTIFAVYPPTRQRLTIHVRIVPASGDGWNEPRDDGGVEFNGVTTDTGNAVDAPVWAWAEAEFDACRADIFEDMEPDADNERDDAYERMLQRRENESFWAGQNRRFMEEGQ